MVERLPSPSCAITSRADSAALRAIAAVELATLLLDPTPEPPPPESDGWRPAAAPSDLRLLAEGTLDRVWQGTRFARLPLEVAVRPGRVRELAGTGMRALRAARHTLAPAPPTALNEPISPRRHLASARRPFAEVRAIKRRHRASVNDVVLAAATGGVRRLFEHRGEAPA